MTLDDMPTLHKTNRGFLRNKICGGQIKGSVSNTGE